MMTRIMIVDDNPANLKLAGDLLEMEGFEVHRSMDAESALVEVSNFRPVLILMDVALPGMDGIQLTRKLKAERKTSKIKIVAFTAFAMKGDRERMLTAGFDGYITKPIDTREFKNQINYYLRNE